ncbi:uncharacterized protein LOC106168598 [Lingula anatina]|uniref:Uncharacterized protein LOC106168598 n=1 Tax=Lingula anatina TaxID=7574 RepID=A0A1S3IYT7_LINAN|nr:uncharacterized protein LOC106168598 [Lingula anatina]|eukprot:XP_013403178.1 uncharacterized protein LOC106168598 [Lingula anatina]
MEELRSLWKVPSIAHFCSLFRNAFDLLDFDIEDFEEALICAGGEEGSPFLIDLICRLLKGCYNRNDIDETNYEQYLQDVMKHRWSVETGRPSLLEDMSFKDICLTSKVEILQAVCDFRLDAEDVADKLKDLEADSLRLEPMGIDALGATYWYFYGTRLYKEDPEPPPPVEKKKENKKKKGKDKKKDKKKKKDKGKKRKDKSKKGKGKADKKRGRPSKKTDQSSDEESEAEEEGTPSEPPPPPPKLWHLICQTTEEWEQLANTFKGSKVKCERELYKTLVEDFVPEIPKMIEAKEREMRKKLLELAPRRTSNRIKTKAQQEKEAEKEKYLLLIQEEERLRQHHEEVERKRRLEEEQQRDVKLQREERSKAREDRAKRARLREERAQLIAEGKEIPAELLNIPASPKRISVPNEAYSAMMKVVDIVKRHKDSWPFWEPVQEEYAPGYRDIITRPMDMSTIEKKVKNREYRSRREFIGDYKLMFSNCLEYNGPESEYIEMADAVEACFHRAVKKYMSKHNFDNTHEDEDDADYHSKLTNGGPHLSFRPQRNASAKAMEALHKVAEDSLQDSRSNSPVSYDESASNSPYPVQRKEFPPFQFKTINPSASSSPFPTQRQDNSASSSPALTSISEDSADGTKKISHLRTVFGIAASTSAAKQQVTSAGHQVTKSSPSNPPFQLLKQKLQEQYLQQKQAAMMAQNQNQGNQTVVKARLPIPIQFSKGGVTQKIQIPVDVQTQKGKVNYITFATTTNGLPTTSATSPKFGGWKQLSQQPKGQSDGVGAQQQRGLINNISVQSVSDSATDKKTVIPPGDIKMQAVNISGTSLLQTQRQQENPVTLTTSTSHTDYVYSSGKGPVIANNNVIQMKREDGLMQGVRQPAKKRKYIEGVENSETTQESPKPKLWRPGIDESASEDTKLVVGSVQNLSQMGGNLIVSQQEQQPQQQQLPTQASVQQATVSGIHQANVPKFVIYSSKSLTTPGVPGKIVQTTSLAQPNQGLLQNRVVYAGNGVSLPPGAVLNTVRHPGQPRQILVSNISRPQAVRVITANHPQNPVGLRPQLVQANQQIHVLPQAVGQQKIQLTGQQAQQLFLRPGLVQHGAAVVSTMQPQQNVAPGFYYYKQGAAPAMSGMTSAQPGTMTNGNVTVKPAAHQSAFTALQRPPN